MATKNVYVTERFVDKDFFDTYGDIIAQSSGANIDYSKVMLKNSEKTAYVLDLPFYDINGNKLFEYDAANNVFKVQGDITATGGIMAYADDGTIGSIWDAMPVATA
ncbi:MAG: hypothetical protein ACQESQ_08885, partial [Bacteroidota bacterium]